jgi:GNAT superfamily N-acetyltransferase
MSDQFVVDRDYKIRRFQSQDDTESIRILCEQLGYKMTPKQILQRLKTVQDNPAHLLCVATLTNSHIIGWAHAQVNDLILIPRQAMLWGLVIDQNYQNRGVGKLLMQYIEQWTEQKGGEGVMLYSNVKRKEAHLFYESLGYLNIKQSLGFSKFFYSEHS